MKKESDALKQAAATIDEFYQGSLTTRISVIEQALTGAGKEKCNSFCSQSRITTSLLDAAVLLKLLTAQINVTIHAVGILVSLPYILIDNEEIHSLSLGAGNTGKGFDLETNIRIAEFTFISWQGGSESARKKKLFKDLYTLAEANTGKQRVLYVIDDHYPLKFFRSRTSIASLMDRNSKKLAESFNRLYQDRFRTVHDYYEHRRDRITIVDLNKIVPHFAEWARAISQAESEAQST
jgi:hypothetical protein